MISDGEFLTSAVSESETRSVFRILDLCWSLITLFILFFLFRDSSPLWQIAVFVVALIGFSLNASRYLRGWLGSYGAFLLHTAYASIIVILSGGVYSPFQVMFLTLGVASGILFKKLFAFSTLVLSLFFYCTYQVFSEGFGVFSADNNLAAVQMLSLLTVCYVSIALTTSVRNAYRNEVLSLRASQSHDLKAATRDLIYGINDPIIITNFSYLIIECNKQARTLFEGTALVGKSLQNLIESIIEDWQGYNLCYELELGGKILLLEGREISDNVVWIFRDITNLKGLEQLMRHQEELNSMIASPTTMLEGIGEELASKVVIGSSEIMNRVFNLVEKVATTDATVLIAGESGTGKEVVARLIHEKSNVDRPFVAVNCAAIPENLIESELFGYKKGAFTGANADHKGLIREAEGGTLFLDEVGELPLNLQSKLLRVLQERRVRPVGSEKDVPVTMRVITATNRDLKEEVRRGNFREDLFFRLNVISITLPPLRERVGDIPMLINHFIKKRSQRLGADIGDYRISPGALDMLLKHSYPGNIRELENIIERAMVLSQGQICIEHLPENLDSDGQSVLSGYVRTERYSGLVRTQVSQILEPAGEESLIFPIDLDELMQKFEARVLKMALEYTDNNQAKAAKAVGLSARSFRYRLGKLAKLDGDEANEITH